MDIKAIMFDIYGTLIDIETDERDWRVYLNLANYLSYRGLKLSADEIKGFYFEKINEQIEKSEEKYPEIDVKKIWRDLIIEFQNPDIYKLNLEQSSFLEDLVVLHRALTLKKLKPFPGTFDTLSQLKSSFRLGIVTDAQQEYAISELKIVGIHSLFNSIIISGDFGFRKPDQRLFNKCLSKLGVSPEEALFVGNDAYRDISGGRSLGLKTCLVMSEYGSKDTKNAEPNFRINNITQLLDKIPKLS
jgi:putative hydrolase of the HAD superfamily